MPESLDLSAIVKLTQALSGEIVTARLVERLLVVAVEHAAAQRGALLLQRGTEQHLEAVASLCAGAVVVQPSGRPMVPTDLPATMVLHAARSGRCVILGDATLANAFSHDPYLQGKAPRSVMCLPLMKQGELMGVLYLEHALAAHVFTPARHAALDLLACQAAISLQNAQLHAMLEQEKAQRKAAEAAVRRAEERYALAVEAATDGHADWIVDEDVFYASPRLLELWGISPERGCPSRQQMLDLFPFHPDDRDRVLSLLDRHLRGNTRRLEFDARVVRRGEVRRMHWTTLYERDATGKLVRTSTATTDVTERMQAEEEMRSSEERYALALAGSNEGVFDWDLRTGSTYLAARTQELLGLPAGD
ncbi:MAG: hypothetical protein JWQ76_5239, partial [Ramlibacter sp.]|nr:hypothetical protein [Ramlibacter sp.]